MNPAMAKYEIERSQAVCDTHGEYASTRVGSRWTPCRACTEAAVAQQRSSEMQEARRESVIAKLQQAAIPELYKAARLEEPVTAWIARAIASGTKGPLVLVGPPGTGKTYQSCAALRRWIARTEKGGHYLTAADYAVQMRSTWGGNRSGESEADVLNRYARSPFVVLDDIGAGRDNDMQIVQTLIDARYRNGLMRHTIVVSNVAAGNFDQAFGERAADRIRECSVLIEMTGESRRRPE